MTPAHVSSLPPVREEALSGADLDARLRGAREPFVVRGLAADWPLVKAGRQGGNAARAYLASHARPRSFTGNVGQSAGEHRLFYTDTMQMNFATVQGPFAQFLDAMQAAESDTAAPVV